MCTIVSQETTAMINLRNVSPKEFAQTLMLSAQNALKIFEEIIGNKEVLMLDPIYEDGAAPKRRYPKRSIERKCYVEEDISSEDESLHCDICNEDYKGACPVHGPMLLVCDTKVYKNDSQKAKNSLPYFLSIGISSLPRAGLGVWTEMPLTPGMVFGPYKGSFIKKTIEAQKSGYAWQVRKGLKVSHYVEGRDEGCSNWMRYVNCADREERQNVVAFQYQGDIYYRTYKPVLPFTEILVWYGDGYASDLGIDLQQEKELECTKEITGFKCDVCEKLFSFSGAFERHRRKHPSTRTDLQHQCPECRYSTDRKTDIHRHMLTHSGEKPHACPRCHKRFSREETLRQHLMVHTGEKKHVCDVCGKKFNRKSALQKHVRLHTGEKPYRCPDCGRDFNEAKNLKDHLKTHTGQRPHRCPHCEYRSTQPGNLSRHIVRMHTQQFPHTCTFCQKGFCSPSDVRKHIERHHSNFPSC
ncbi:probable histone-lysine N-methyltransferase PRDM7 [Trichonephila inaurata madagascariensis]|uniref:Probable histone-lysine N-methyltransferase PRDM7 n=1 Tax=Trichonephila inaurata madagascariensis TaxID=2747483 RepID=A0A8X7C6F6_9ARAC|nr:probable histone-lysine N-methyltransferase PRDM7 [Trichonephila inaurata madagascariensis]